METSHKPNPVDYSPCPCCNFIPEMRKSSKRRKFHTPHRIKLLAEPKCVTPKFKAEIPVKSKKEIQIIREEPISTRLQQLAIPKVRKLVAARDEYRKFKNEYFIERFNHLINKSLFTVYSRLANVRIPVKREKPVKWTQDEWNKHQEWLRYRAKHKWPYDIPELISFTDPLVKLPPREVLLKRSITPWVKNYEWQLKWNQEQSKQENDKLKGKDEPISYEKWKEQRELMKSRPISPYLEEYGNKLKSEAAKMKTLREKRKAELEEGPFDLWDESKRKKQLEHQYKSRPKWVEKLSAQPDWLKQKSEKEKAEMRDLEQRMKAAGDRAKIKKFGGGPRSLKLALATEEQKHEIKSALKAEKRERDAIQEGYKLKNEKMKTLPEGHKLYKSVQKLSKPLKIREKVKLQDNYNRFKNYW